jgi:flagellar hook assembly protein FlgD
VAPVETFSFSVGEMQTKDNGEGIVLTFTIPSSEQVRLDIRNATDYMVRNLLDEFTPAGNHEVVWDGRNNDGEKVNDGIYLIELTAGGYYALNAGVVEW